MMRDNHLTPVDLGVEQPITVRTYKGWLAAMKGEGEAITLMKQMAPNAG